MFTGLVEATGTLESIETSATGKRLRIAAAGVVAGTAIGDSVALNGCCLTVVAIDGDSLTFDLLEETWRLTSFAKLQEGAKINLERALPADGRLGGHFVSGHVDGVGTVSVNEQRGDNIYLKITGTENEARYLVNKGSIAIEGISLTVVDVTDSSFAVWIIPHTVEVTNLSDKKTGDFVNLEFDILAKYVEKQMENRLKAEG